MKKLFTTGLAFIAGVFLCHGAFATQQPVTTITAGTGTAGLSLKQYNDTYINPRLTNVQVNFTDLYTNKADSSCFANSTAFNNCFALDWPTGGVTSYNNLTDKPIAGTDYLAPNGSAANLTNFPSTLATDAEVSTAVAGKANLSAFASQAAFLAAFGWLPTATFDTTADATITGDWSFSSGLNASHISLNLGTLADLTIGNAQMVDDTKGSWAGDGIFLWSAKHTYDQLATKQDTLVSGTNIKSINGQSLIGVGNITITGGDTPAFAFDTFPAYSDSPHTVGLAKDGTRIAFWNGAKWLTITGQDTLSTTPILRTLTITAPAHGTITCSDADLSTAITCGTGGSTCVATAVDGASISGISATPDSGYTLTALTGDIASGSVTMDTDKAGSATFTEAAATIMASQTSSYAYTISTNLAGASQLVGQSFTVSESKTANSVVVYGAAAGASTITVKIGTSTDMSSTYLATGTLSYAGGSDGEIEIPLTTGVTLTPGTYYLSVGSNASYTNRVILKGSSSSSYSGGQYYSTTTGWPLASPSASIDLYFKVIGQ